MQSNQVNVTVGRQVADALTNRDADSSSAAMFAPGALNNSVPSGESVDIVTKAWTSNPYSWSTTGGSTAAGVVSVEVLSSVDNSVVSVTDAAAPIIVSLVAPLSTDLEVFRCLYWNNDTGTWDSDGTLLIGAVTSVSSLTVSCATNHLSDFSAKAADSSGFLQLYIPNPLDHVGELGNAFSGSSLITTIVVFAVFGTCLLAWLVSSAIDNRKAETLAQLRRAHILMYGEIRAGMGKVVLHEVVTQAGRRKLQAKYDLLKVCCVCWNFGLMPPT